MAIAPLPSALHRLGETFFSLRPRLKEDLEILRLIDPSDPNYKIVKGHIDRAIAERYRRPASTSPFNWQGLVVGPAGCVFMVLWTVKLRALGYRYWPWLTGLISLIFFIQFALSLRDKARGAAKRKPAPAAELVE